jgi:hypothetical protein
LVVAAFLFRFNKLIAALNKGFYQGKVMVHGGVLVGYKQYLVKRFIRKHFV